jgi:hypothetical protein
MYDFNLVSHYAAVLPIALAFIYEFNFLSLITTVTVLISLIHHVAPENNIWACVDIFFSSSLVIIVYYTYIIGMRNVFVAPVLTFLLFMSLISVFASTDIVTYFMAFLILCAATSFTYERQVKKNKSDVYNVTEPYFVSFVVNQLLAVYFYLKAGYDDNDKYSHSFWHIFAFTALASLIVHISPIKREELDKTLFYWLGSVPCRLFISWVFLDWEKTESIYSAPILCIFILITMVIAASAIRMVSDKAFLPFRVLNTLLYVTICYFIGYGDMRWAGYFLLCTLVVSVTSKLLSYLYDDKEKGKEVVSFVDPDTKQINVEFRF